MAFNVTTTARSDSDKPKIDYDALNQYLVEAAGLETKEVLTGYISGIVDLGEQDQEDAEVVFNGDAQDEADILEKFPNNYFKDGIDEATKKPVRLKCWPQKAIQSVAVAVDFPDIIIDKGQFFGNSNPQPLRMWLGGQFYIQNVGMVVGRPTPLKENMSLGKWSFDKKHLFHKMAVASKLIKSDEIFKPQDIDQLLGKAFQFEVQIYFKESKGKKYLTEYIKFNGGLGRGQVTPEIVNPPFVVQFTQENDPEALSQLRWHVTNTIKQAKNYEGSKIQLQLESEQDEPDEVITPKATKPVQTAKNTKAETTEDPALDDSPF
jgi:hypothetical protein